MKLNIFKTAFISLGINFAFGLYNGVLGALNRSYWFFALAIYFIVLGVMRFGILLNIRHSNDNNSKFITRFTGGMLIFMGITMAGIVYMASADKIGGKYHQIIMITMALYAFSKITLAIINLVKAHRTNGYTVKALRNISLADAAVSIFSLQRSMLVSFEGMTDSNIFLMNCLTGTAVYVLIFLLGINLLGGKKVNMAKSKIVKANQKIADTVVGGYKAVESAVVGTYTKIEDRFVDQFLTHEGETVEDAKTRLKKETNKSVDK